MSKKQSTKTWKTKGWEHLQFYVRLNGLSSIASIARLKDIISFHLKKKFLAPSDFAWLWYINSKLRFTKWKFETNKTKIVFLFVRPFKGAPFCGHQAYLHFKLQSTEIWEGFFLGPFRTNSWELNFLSVKSFIRVLSGLCK